MKKANKNTTAALTALALQGREDPLATATTALFSEYAQVSEADAVSFQTFPPAKLVERLALSASGFVFDPVAGNSFTANETGITVLRMLQDGVDEVAEIVEYLGREYDAPDAILERDVLDFAARLCEVLR